LDIIIKKGKELDKEKKKILKQDNNFLYDDDFLYFLAFENEKIVGYACVKDSQILNVFVFLEYRFKSIGSKIVNSILHWASKRKMDRMTVVKTEDKKIQYFFKRNGFKIGSEIYIDNIMADQKREKEGVFSTYLSIIVNLFLAIIKAFFGIVGKSNALFADGLHSLSDVITSVVVLVSIYLAGRPADEKHPYGHGKIESISGNMVGLILVITSFELIIENIKNFFIYKEITIPKTITIYIVILSIFIKFILYIYKNKVAIKLNNDAILADAKDHKSDIISSIGVLIGIILAKTISPSFDIIAGVIVGILIGKEGLSIIFQTSSKILDKQEETFIEDIKELVEKDEEVNNVHDVFMKYSANKIYLSFHMRVDKNMTVCASHLIVDRIMEKIKNKYIEVQDIVIHVDPIRD